MKKIFSLLAPAILSLIVSACGSDLQNSEVKAPPVQVYRFNGSGTGAGVTGTWVYTPSPTACQDAVIWDAFCERMTVGPTGSAFLLNSFRSSVAFSTPPMTFNPGAQGYGHISVVVETKAMNDGLWPNNSPTTFVVDLISDGPSGPIVHDSKAITFDGNSSVVPVSLNAPAFSSPLVNAQVRVRDIYIHSDFLGGKSAPGFMLNFIDIIYN